MFAILGVELITKDPLLADTPYFDERFGNLGRIILTLLQFVTLDDVNEIYLPIVQKRPWLVLYFLALILIVSLALMNLVTASIVTGALAQSQEDEELHRQEQRRRVKKLMPHFQLLFDRLDTGRTGSV